MDAEHQDEPGRPCPMCDGTREQNGHPCRLCCPDGQRPEAGLGRSARCAGAASLLITPAALSGEEPGIL